MSAFSETDRSREIVALSAPCSAPRLTMTSPSRPIHRASGVVIAAILGAIAIGWLSAGASTAHAAGVGALQQGISARQSQVSGLSGAVKATSGQLARLNGSIATLQGQIARIQADLDAKRADLLRLRGALIAARTRLAQLETFEVHAQAVLSRQLVNSYESDRPNIVGVVLAANGFSDLLERLAFARRIQTQDAQVVGQVRTARQAVAAQATRLGGLEARQQLITTQVLTRRDSLARARLGLVQRQIVVARSQATSTSRLADVRGQLGNLQRQLSKLQAAQAAAAAARAAASAPGPGSSNGSGTSSGSSSSSGSGSSSSSGAGGAPQVSSGGGFTFPMSKGAATPPGTWTLDQGVDIAAPGGTALLAVGSGTIVLHGIGGFGPSAPVLHLDTGQYVYYGHAGPGNMLAIGTHVSAGQVISEVGSGIVGFSSGPHLEIGYCDSSGTPLGGGTASQMLSLLQGAYGG